MIIVEIPQADRVGVAGVGALKGQQTEIAQAVLGDAVVLFDDFVAVERQVCTSMSTTR
jgi:hypothetical protein